MIDDLLKTSGVETPRVKIDGIVVNSDFSEPIVSSKTEIDNILTGEFKFDASFFSGVTEVQSKISRGSLQDYLDGFSGKDLNLEQTSVVIREDIKRFSDFKEFSDFLELYDINPPSKELFFLAKKGADTILHRDLLLDPKKISINDLDYFQKIDLGFDDLFSSFLKSGDKTVVNDFFEKFNNGNLDIKLIDISSNTLNDLLNTNLLDKTKLSKFILSYSGKNLSPENLYLLKKYLEKNGLDLFTQDMLRKITTEIEVKLDKFNPNNIVKSYLEGIDLDFSTGELLIKNSPGYRAWNTLFESSFDSRFNMIFRGKNQFFHELNIDRFFNLTIHELTDLQRGRLYELVIEGGEYYDRIKGYSDYDNIVEVLKKSHNKTK
ncbi:hypothetical protein HUU51_01050 [Candidatus Gracilibacteria bacterium]|nr:hypothetical protein [Candidatus Gracilibacteria bacterium]